MGLFAVDGGLRHGFFLCVRHEVALISQLSNGRMMKMKPTFGSWSIVEYLRDERWTKMKEKRRKKKTRKDKRKAKKDQRGKRAVVMLWEDNLVHSHVIVGLTHHYYY